MKRVLSILLTLTLFLAGMTIQTTPAQAAKKPKISQKKLSLKVGKTKKLKIKNLKKGKKVVWKSSKKKIATVSKKGVVKAKKAGKTTITAKVSGKKYTCKVTVTKKKTKKKTTISNNPYDGDVYYKTPSNYRSIQKNVKYGTVKTVSYYSTKTKKNRKVSVVLPAGYSTAKKYPVCYLLHGLGQDYTDWLNAKAPTIVGNMIASGTAKEMILVLPNCRARENDSANPSDAFSLSNYRAFDNFINDLRDNLMPYIKANYSILEGRENTAIAGFSMGGRTALYIGMSMQDTFGYIGGFAPAPGIFAYRANGVSENGLFKKEDFRLKNEYANNTLVMIVAGKSDNIVGNNPEIYHNALASNNSKHIWYKVSGGHDFNVMNNALYNFASRIFK